MNNLGDKIDLKNSQNLVVGFHAKITSAIAYNNFSATPNKDESNFDSPLCGNVSQTSLGQGMNPILRV